MSVELFDLYKLYKKFYQRSYRNPYDEDLSDMTALAKEIAKKTLIEEFLNNKSTANRKITLMMAKKLEELESNYGFSVFFSNGLVPAIKNNLYCSNVPYQKRHGWQDVHGFKGYVYLFSSKSKPNQIKIGATTMEPSDRARKYSNKYGYQVDLVLYETVTTPFEVEKQLAESLKDFRVKGNTLGDSNEWYSLEIPKAQKIFKEIIRKYSSEHQHSSTI